MLGSQAASAGRRVPASPKASDDVADEQHQRGEDHGEEDAAAGTAAGEVDGQRRGQQHGDQAGEGQRPAVVPLGEIGRGVGELAGGGRWPEASC